MTKCSTFIIISLLSFQTNGKELFKRKRQALPSAHNLYDKTEKGMEKKENSSLGSERTGKPYVGIHMQLHADMILSSSEMLTEISVCGTCSFERLNHNHITDFWNQDVLPSAILDVDYQLGQTTIFRQ